MSEATLSSTISKNALNAGNYADFFAALFSLPFSQSRLVGRLLAVRSFVRSGATKWKVRKEGRKEGWNLSSLSYENGPRRDGLGGGVVVGGDGDDSHRDDAGNFSDFLSRVSPVLLPLLLLRLLARASISLGKSVHCGYIAKATLTRRIVALEIVVLSGLSQPAEKGQLIM